METVNIYANKCACGKLIPANLPMNSLCALCAWKKEQEKPCPPPSA